MSGNRGTHEKGDDERVSIHDFGAWELVRQIFHRHRPIQDVGDGFRSFLPDYAECRCGAVRVRGPKWLAHRRDPVDVP